MIKHAPLIETERLFLRGIEEKDTDIIVKWRSAPEVYQYLGYPHPLTAREHEKWFKEVYSPDANRGDWLAEEKTTGTPVGLFGLKQEGQETVEVGYLLDPEARSLGYAQEALERLLKWAKEYCGMKAANAKIHRDNTASLKFIERMQFQRYGEADKFVFYKRTL